MQEEIKCPGCEGSLQLEHKKGPWGSRHLVCIDCKKGWSTTEKYIYDGKHNAEVNHTLEVDGK
jgi:hypothetical protein